jgi:hypothetical protein
MLALSLALACGPGEEQRTLPDESGDLDVGGERRGHLEGTRPHGPDLGGTHWRYVESTCTEGSPRFIEEGFERTADVYADSEGLLFVYDHQLGEGCRETVVQRAKPGAETDQAWSMTEEARVHQGECPTDPEPDRPGDVRRRGDFLEVYVQRSNWCNGLEVKMVYAPAEREAFEGEELIRRYAAHFNRQDAGRITQLFAANGSLVDPFTRTPTDQPMRFDGQRAIYEWFEEAFGNTPWLAMRVTGIEAGPAPGAFTMTWEYMDPRLDAPFGGRNLFTIAGGEIFETTVEITQQEVEVETRDGSPVGGEDAEEEASEEPPAPGPPPADPESGSE